MSKLRSRLTYANVASSLALFIALSTGGAYAVNTIGSSDIVDESIQSVDIKNGEIKASEYAPGSVGPNAIGSNAVKNDELASNVVGTGKIHDGGVGTADLAGGAVTGAKVAANTLGGNQIDESALDLGGFFVAGGRVAGLCTADDGGLTTCAVTSITLPRPGRLLLNATATWTTFKFDDTTGTGSEGDDPTRVRGGCQFDVDGIRNGPVQIVSEHQAGQFSQNNADGQSMALTSLTEVVGAGTHTIDVACLEEDGDVDWPSMSLTAALVDDDGTSPLARRHAPAPAGAPDVKDHGKR